MDAAQVKTLLLITSDKYDTYLEAVVPMFEAKIRQRATALEDGESLPPDLQHTLAKWVQHDMNNRAGLESRTMGDVSYNFSNAVPEFVKDDIAPYRAVTFK